MPSEFTAKYYSNPEYKQKHLKYVLEKVPCEICGVDVARCYLAKHKRSKKHATNETLHEKREADEQKLGNTKNALIKLNTLKDLQKLAINDDQKKLLDKMIQELIN